MSLNSSWLSLAPAACIGQWKQTDQRLVRLTQVVMVWLLCTLTLIGASMQSYLRDNLTQLLGSDLVLVQDQPLTSAQVEHLRGSSKAVSTTVVSIVNLAFEDQWRRVQLKQVDDVYPVQGKITVASQIGADQQLLDSGPARGEIWLGTRLASRLGVSTGESLQIGDQSFTFSALLVHEPDRLQEGHNVEMRAMINAASLPPSFVETGQHRHRYLIKADQAQRNLIEAWTREQLPGAGLLDRHKGRHPLSAYWQRIQNFLGLSFTILLLMAAVAICLANRRRVEEQQYRLALLLSMGMPMHRGVTLLVLEWLLPFLATLPVALMLAYVSQWLAVDYLHEQFPGLTSGHHGLAVLQTVLLSLGLLFLLQIPMLLTLRKTRIALLVKRVSEPVRTSSQWLFVGGSIALLAYSYSDNWHLTTMLITSVIATIGLLVLLAWFTLWCGQKLTSSSPGLVGFSFFLLYEQRWMKSAQIIGLGVSLMLLLFSLVLATDIRESMVSQTRQFNGNLLITEATSSEVLSLTRFLEDNYSHIRHQRAFVNARVLSVNDKQLKDFISQPSEASARLERPIRLAWSNEVPENNTISRGEWWQPRTEKWRQVSVEDEVMIDLGIRLGDKLTFLIAGQVETFEIVAGHQFKSGASSMTFWFQAPAVLEEQFSSEVRWMGSAELGDAAWAGLASVATDNPGMILMPLNALTERFDRTMAIVVQSTIGFALMVLMMSLLVAAASIVSSQAEDRRRNGLLRSFGLKSADCEGLARYEWSLTGMLAATGAVLGTCVTGLLVYQSEFGMAYDADWSWLLSAAVLVTISVTLLGTLGTRGHREAGIRALLVD